MADQLEAYRKKRDFKVTSEPAGKARTRKGKALSFVIQKHAATRLHYDFRLELDGVLKSWAVTRGPSLDPGDKRLAVHVEDHPLEYGSFEGTIPAGEYGAGSVLLWDRGTWTPEGDPHKGYAKGHLEFSLEGEKLHGRWHLVKMRGKPKEKADNWLLIKADDEQAAPGEGEAILAEQPRSVETQRTIEEIGGDRKSRRWHSNKPAHGTAPSKPTSPKRRAAAPLEEVAPETPSRKTTSGARRTRKQSPRRLELELPKSAKRASLPRFVEPELATLSTAPPSGEGYLHEVKFDGYRIQAALQNGKTVLRTRKGLDWTERFMPIAEAVSGLPVESAVLDGEIVVEDANGVADFAALQKALRGNEMDALAYYAFDLLHLNGHDLTKLTLVQRKDLLKQILAAAPDATALRYSEHFAENGELMLKHICRLSAEGIVSKRKDAPYRSGRGGDWLKSKCSNRQEFVIIGYVPSTAVKKAVGSLVVGYHAGGALVHAGRVGTGFSNDLAKDLHRDLQADSTDRSPVKASLPTEARKNVVWVKPRLVAEVEFRGWTGGDLLRQASFKGLREDKDPREIVREEPKAMTAGETSATRRKTASTTRDPNPSVRLTHPDRVLWPDAGVTKQGLADYYASVWPQIEKHIAGRPLALVRCPTGIGHCFFQKHAWDGMSEDIVRLRDPQDGETLVGVSSLEGLLGLVQASVLEIHPWGATADDLDRPDRIIFDLDPGDGVSWGALVDGAREIRRRLADLKLESFVKTTGGKGLHVVAPLTPSVDWDTAKAFCHRIADEMAADSPQAYLSKMSKQARKGRIYVDYLRNGRGATAVAAFSTRARPSCGISTPVSFDELDEIGSGDRFTLDTVARRLESRNDDPWADFFRVKQKIPGVAASAAPPSRKASGSTPGKKPAGKRAASKRKPAAKAAKPSATRANKPAGRG